MAPSGKDPIRTCVGCRGRAPQATLVRFVRARADWSLDTGTSRAPGRGAYLCSAQCSARALKNKRYPGLTRAAESADWNRAVALCAGGEDVYDKRVPHRALERG